jgi:magnesium and cobalt transporter
VSLSKNDETRSWFLRLKQFLQLEPQNKEQLIHLLREATNRTLIDSATFGMIESVIEFAKMQVRDIMLPRKQMTSLSQNDSLTKIIHTITHSGHSRFPVTGVNKDEIIGILHAKDLLRFHGLSNQTIDLGDMVRQVMFVPESKRLDVLLSEFRNTRNHMALVVDEYGAISGFVTIEDIIEQIIGDIEDEFDVDEETYIKIHRDAYYIIKAHTPIDEFNSQLNVQFSAETYDTIGGIVMANFGYLPKRGEVTTVEPFEFKIINADSRGIKLLGCLDRRVTSNVDVLKPR